MAKRLTDSTKWDDPWFMDLPNKYKLFWLYLLDTCDHAGIWKVNFKVANFYIGEHLEPSEVKRILSDRITVIDETYWYIEKFITFQYGGIKADAVGKSVQKILIKHNLIAPSEGLSSPYQGTKDKDKVKATVKDMAKTKEDIKNELFSDEIWIEQLSITHKGKDISQAFEECYSHHSADPLSKAFELWQWRQKLNTWLTIKKSEKVKTVKKLHDLS